MTAVRSPAVKVSWGIGRFGLRFEIAFNESKSFAFAIFDFSAIAAGKAVLCVVDAMELEGDVVFLEFGGHRFGLFERNVGVGCAVNKDGRRIISGDVLNGHVWEEFFRFSARVPAGNCFWPETVLATEIIKDAAVAFAFARVGNR